MMGIQFERPALHTAESIVLHCPSGAMGGSIFDFTTTCLVFIVLLLLDGGHEEDLVGREDVFSSFLSWQSEYLL